MDESNMKTDNRHTNDDGVAGGKSNNIDPGGDYNVVRNVIFFHRQFRRAWLTDCEITDTCQERRGEGGREIGEKMSQLTLKTDQDLDLVYFH